MLYVFKMMTEPDDSAGVVIVAEADSANEARLKATKAALAAELPGVAQELEYTEPRRTNEGVVVLV